MMNDKNGKALAVGQRVRFSHEHNVQSTVTDAQGRPQRINTQTFVTYEGTVEALFDAGVPHPRGGGETLQHGKKFPPLVSTPAIVAARQDYADGGAIAPGKSGHDLVIVQLTGADRAQHMPDHCLATCTQPHLRAHEATCACPVRGWWPAAQVEVLS